VAAPRAVSQVQPADQELVADRLAEAVHVRVVVAQGNPEPAVLHMEESRNLVAPVVPPAAAVMTEVVSLNS
jgi:hypothetical protein